MFFVIWVSFMATKSNRIFVNCSKFWSSSKFVFSKQELIWKKDVDFSLLGIFNCCNSSVSWYLLCITFSGSLLFSGMALLNLLKRSAECGEGFRIRELFDFFIHCYKRILEIFDCSNYQMEKALWYKKGNSIVCYYLVNICYRNN